MGVMLPEEALVGAGSAGVGAGVAPAVEQVAAHIAVAAGVSARRFCGRAVVNDP